MHFCKNYHVMLQRKRIEANNASSIAYFTSAAAAAKSLQSCPTLCDPIDGSPLGSSVPDVLQARILWWVVISFSNAWKWKVKVKSLSCALGRFNSSSGIIFNLGIYVGLSCSEHSKLELDNKHITKLSGLN